MEGWAEIKVVALNKLSPFQVKSNSFIKTFYFVVGYLIEVLYYFKVKLLLKSVKIEYLVDF